MVLLSAGCLFCIAGKTEIDGRILVQVFRWTHLTVKLLLFAFLGLLAAGLVVVLVVTRSAHTQAGPVHPIHLTGPQMPQPAQPPIDQLHQMQQAFGHQRGPAGASYGMARTVHIHIIATSAEPLQSKLLPQVVQALKLSAGARSFSVRHFNATADVQAAPIDDLDAAARTLPFDPKSVTIDHEHPEITVDLTAN